MEWQDDGALLSIRRHAEGNAIAEIFTPSRGRHVGVVRGGGSRRLAPILQPGAQLSVTWRARLEDHMGNFTVEPVKSRSAAVMSDRAALAGLSAVTALAAFALPERAAYPRFYAQTITVLDLLGTSPSWPYAYLRWELALLEEMGFGLDFSTCAAGGNANDLSYVSPRTGRAVSRMGAGEWADRLLPLPPALMGEPPRDTSEILEGLRTTGHFLETRLRPSLGERPLPPARARLIAALSRL
ncbi:DNA repair protein RecO [Tropicimonas sp. IMCC34011]|uniref:DNA repair protein RecO n=1 Tax=Tropicimonas sp. IMCC34011 TaxID=2248759 RepID=UPI0018E4F98F|nr:DNA repair protein RecO [Tropicimonas sp. IMCC34011]